MTNKETEQKEEVAEDKSLTFEQKIKADQASHFWSSLHNNQSR
jgi:hypothetical protein